MVKLDDNPADGVGGARMAYVALGSNLGLEAVTRGALTEARLDPDQIVEAAMARLGEFGVVEARSSLYVTEPVGPVRQAEFVNAVVGLRTMLAPAELLAGLMRVEREFGRERGLTPPKGPRSLDLDVLLMEGVVMATEELTVPHPALAQRRFVLAPLAEIAPGAVHPVLEKTISELLEELADAGENRIGAVRRVCVPGPEAD